MRRGVRRRGSRLPRALGLVATLACLSACAPPGVAPAESPEGTPTNAPAEAVELSGTVTVFAAASLTETFDDLASRFEAQHPAVEVVLVLGGSSNLVQQVIAGAPADVLATADEDTMQRAVDAEVVETPSAFARNPLALAVPAGNPGAVAGIADLAREDLIVALCASEVPCGRAADALLSAGGVTPSVDTRESDVRAVLTKIQLGEVDVGIVYSTDVRVAGDAVESLELERAERFAPTYAISVVRGSEHRAAAEAWVRFVQGTDGRALLAAAGFGAVS